MNIGSQVFRYCAVLATAVAIVSATSSSPRAQAVPAIDRRITYVLPQWLEFLSANDVAQQAKRLRSTLGEGPRVRVGFTTYISIVMAPVDPADTVAVRAALSGTFAQVDEAIARAQAGGIPICLSFVTAIRSGTDALQTAAQSEDRRNMQWHADNSLAAGWTTFSRYARKQERIQEAFIRELGRFLAGRMLQYPDIVVAASGDGEIELSGREIENSGGALLIADYSPFAVAEFRDWLRGTGLYAPGQPFAGEAYASAWRYASDASIATLNADFNVSFDTWALKYNDWSLADDPLADPRAIPASSVSEGAFEPAIANPNGFDPPRTHVRGDAWSDLWDQFRATMVWRYNLAFAKWITTSPDPATGATVPGDRWFSDQIPADYLFGGTPANPNGRMDLSASPIWTADISPYGSMGITSFNVNFQTFFAKTLAGAAPVVAARRVRWGIFEWNPSIGPSPTRDIYDEEMALVERYRPSLLAPFMWNATSLSVPEYGVDGTLFADSLRDLITRLNHEPLRLSDSAIDIGATTDGAAKTPPQTIRVSGVPGESPPWTIASAPAFLDVAIAPDGRSFTVALKPGTYGAGTVKGYVVVESSEPGYAPTTLDIALRVVLPSAAAPPQGALDSPADGVLVSGEVAVTGWAVDDLGLASVRVYRNAVAGESGLIYIGDATFVPSARPDVEAAFAGRPRNEQAGWGYMLLTNMLPGGGDGTFTLTVTAVDVEGHEAVIGQRRIVGQNSDAPLPFGTIDTPLQGQTVSGTFVNFGWALTGQPRSIPVDGSTIDVYIDGVAVGHPTYGFARSDIQGLFPGYANTDTAVGFYMLDTTQLTNGLHTIFWVVRDSSGAAQGIGSRFFTVANP